MKLPRYDVDNWLAKKERHHLTVIRRRITYLDERIARARKLTVILLTTNRRRPRSVGLSR
jgi:hypothetical protein